MDNWMDQPWSLVPKLLAILVGGLFGSAHCVGMCGGFAAALGATEQPPRRGLVRQLVYSFGRLFTYGFLGAVGGYVGRYLTSYQSTLIGAQQVFSVLAGVIMIAVGVMALGIFRFRWLRPGALGETIAPMFRHFLDAPGRTGVFLAGVANGFLPCGLVYAFLSMAVASGSVFQGFLLMVAFGMGTVPIMVLVGCGSTLLTHQLRHRIYRVAACLVILAGAVTIVRGWPGADRSCCADDAPSPISVQSEQ